MAFLQTGFQIQEAEIVDTPVSAVGSHTTATPDASTTLTIPAGATGVWLQANGAAGARFTLDGTAPTATKGFFIPQNTIVKLSLFGTGYNTLNIINVTATQTVDYQFIKSH